MAGEAHQKSREVWDAMAPGWERQRDFMWRTTKHVAEWIVDHADPREGDTILDLAGGAGDMGFLVAERIGPTGKVIETDFAPQMVDVAKRRADQLGLENVETRLLDAENMDLAADSVDSVICRWGFMLMIDPAKALAECRRVVKDGRPLSFSVWGPPEQNPWVTIVGMTMIQLGHQPGGDPFGPGGMFSMANEDTIRRLLSEAGFENVTVEPMPVEWRYGSFDEAWAFMTEVAGAIASVVKELPPAEVDKVRTALEANVQNFVTGSQLVLPGVTLNALAS